MMTDWKEKRRAMQWKAASAELRRVREEELKSMDEHMGFPAVPNPNENGLVI